MSGFRKTIAVLFIIFIGIPFLMGIIWGVGVTRAVVSPKFLSEIPQDIIAQVPNLIEETIESLDREDAIQTEDGKRWIRAMNNIQISPRELLEKMGIIHWLRNELSNSLEDIGKMLRGEIGFKPVVLNMRPLKRALQSEYIEQYVSEILKEFPPCTQEQMNTWIEEIESERPFEYVSPPACQPTDVDTAAKAFRLLWVNEIEDIPDEVVMMDSLHWEIHPDKGIKALQIVVSLTYLLFFFPALFLLLTALVANPSLNGILRWVGFPVLIAGILSFGFSKLMGRIIQWGIEFGSVQQSYTIHNYSFNNEAGEIIFEKMGDIIYMVMNHIFSAVNTVSGTVCIVGIILIALSYLIKRDDNVAINKPTPSSQG